MTTSFYRMGYDAGLQNKILKLVLYASVSEFVRGWADGRAYRRVLGYFT